MLLGAQRFSLWKHSAPRCDHWLTFLLVLPLCQDKAQTLLQLHRSVSIDTTGWINSASIWTQPKAFILNSAKASCTWTFLLRRLISCLGSPNSYTLLTFSYPHKTFALCCNSWDSIKMQKLGEKLWKSGWVLCLLPTQSWESGEYKMFYKNCKFSRSV